MFGVSVKIKDIDDQIQWAEGVHHPAVRNFMLANGVQVRRCNYHPEPQRVIMKRERLQDNYDMEVELMKSLAKWEAENGGWPLNPSPPPLRPPPELFERFTLNGSVIFSVDYRDESVPSAYVPCEHLPLIIIMTARIE